MQNLQFEFVVQSNYDHPETNEPNHCHLLSTLKSAWTARSTLWIDYIKD